MFKFSKQFFLYSIVLTVVVIVLFYVLFFNKVGIAYPFLYTELLMLFATIFLAVSLALCIFSFLFPIKIKQVKKPMALDSIEKYRREFLGNVSHELKTPIFNIQGYIETLLDGALYDKSVNTKYLKRTIKSVDRLIYIIQDLESIAHLESTELSLEITKWNLKSLINDIFEQFEIKAKKKKIHLKHNHQSTNVIVQADKGKISQVLTNLISNSIKYGRSGGHTYISCHQTKTTCQVIVKDDGIGIAEKHIHRLFERFYRVDKSRSREQGGTGLGLAIVKHIMEAHEEHITVRSSMGRGTEFMFSLPVVSNKNNL